MSNQKPMLSDQVLLDIPCVESNIFNIKCIYQEMVDITWDIDLEKQYSNVLKLLYKHNIAVK